MQCVCDRKSHSDLILGWRSGWIFQPLRMFSFASANQGICLGHLWNLLQVSIWGLKRLSLAPLGAWGTSLWVQPDTVKFHAQVFIFLFSYRSPLLFKIVKNIHECVGESSWDCSKADKDSHQETRLGPSFTQREMILLTGHGHILQGMIA